MAADTTTDVTEGFGQVSRSIGRLFRALLLAATLFGIVFVTILLVYVANDAIQPLTADPGWHLTFFLSLVVPTLAASAYAYRRDGDAFQTGALAMAISAAKLEKRVRAAVASQTAQQASPIGQAIAMCTPSVVATPLPPRNFSQTGNR